LRNSVNNFHPYLCVGFFFEFGTFRVSIESDCRLEDEESYTSKNHKYKLKTESKRHIEFERVCQNTYSNVAKLLENGKSLAKQFKEYHTQIGQKCKDLQGIDI